MNSNLKVFLLSLGLLLSAFSTISTVTAQIPSQGFPVKSFLEDKKIMGDRQSSPKQSLSVQQNNFILTASQQVKNRELEAFFSSTYDYWDARILSDYWGQSIDEAKARVGRKILWGKSDVAILEQFLVDARIKALQKMQGSNPSLELYGESKYKYNDAAKLANLWGERSPWDAKIRIEKNLILGQEEIIEKALLQTKR